MNIDEYRQKINLFDILKEKVLQIQTKWYHFDLGN